ncbi:MAG: hypothetical protein RJA76_613 [Bacteroidota bacterium]|jgi:tetratricopeptide (TPR) repeat protein
MENKGEEIPPLEIFDKPLDVSKQIVYLTSLINENPQPQLLFYRARAYFLSHQYHLAKIDLDQLFNKSNEINEEYIFLNAWVNVRLGNLQEATELTNLSTFSANKTSENLPMFFELYANSGIKGAAKNIFNMIQVKDKLSEKDEFNLIGSHLLSGDTSFVISYFSKNTLKDYQNDFLVKTYLKYGSNVSTPLAYQKVCLEVLQRYPLDAYYLNYWAKFLSKMRKFDQAEKVFQKTLQLLPSNQELVFDLAKFYFDIHHYAKATLYFEKIDPVNGLYPESQYWKAISLLYQGKKVEAKNVIDSLGIKRVNQKRWLIKFYQNYFTRNDSTNIKIDSIINLNQ